MGFFSDLKEDLSQAVDKQMPDELSEKTVKDEIQKPTSVEPKDVFELVDNVSIDETPANEAPTNEAPTNGAPTNGALTNEILIDEPPIKEASHMEEALNVDSSAPVAEASTVVITAGMKIRGDITSDGSIDVVGIVEGDIDICGRLNITGHIIGNSHAAEICVEGAKIAGALRSDGAVKVEKTSVIIGDITAKSVVVSGAVKGNIDVQGTVILEASAIVLGNIKSKSVRIDNGAVFEGMCSQCYADVTPLSFFEECEEMIRSGNKNK